MTNRWKTVLALALGATLAVPALRAQKGPQPKSQKELAALQAVQAATTPDEQIKAIDSVLENFADTEFKVTLLQLGMQAAEKKNDYPLTVTYAERILERIRRTFSRSRRSIRRWRGIPESSISTRKRNWRRPRSTLTRPLKPLRRRRNRTRIYRRSMGWREEGFRRGRPCHSGPDCDATQEIRRSHQRIQDPRWTLVRPTPSPWRGWGTRIWMPGSSTMPSTISIKRRRCPTLRRR